jgi:hypothetical protein
MFQVDGESEFREGSKKMVNVPYLNGLPYRAVSW